MLEAISTFLTASGNVNVSSIKGDVRAMPFSGVIRIANPGARVEASDTSEKSKSRALRTT